MQAVQMLVVVGLMLAWSAQANAAFRCGTALVDTGAWPVEVEERCGEPDYVATYPQAVIPGIGVVQTEEHWYYNTGPQNFIRRLIFRNGKLRQEETLGYGFNPGAAGSCTPRLLREGLSEYEVVARCGEPLSKRITWQAVREFGQRRSSLESVVPVEEWLYEFRRAQFRRVVTFRKGQIVSVDTADKPR